MFVWETNETASAKVASDAFGLVYMCVFGRDKQDVNGRQEVFVILNNI